MNIREMVKAYSGMVFGKTDYWHPEMKVNTSLNTTQVLKYPVSMSAKAYYPGIFDREEIPLVDVDGKLNYLPVTIAQYALGHYDEYLTNHNVLHKEALLRCADWFVANLAQIRPGIWGWLNEHDKGIYALAKPWLSALSQGQGLSLLARAYLETGEERYLEIGLKALEAFFIPVADGGLVAFLNGQDFYEEYPSQTPSFVLNGFIFALWGLWDFYLVSGNLRAKERYATGVKTLKSNMELYNMKALQWSRYDLYPFKVADIASIFYHNLHIEQLRALSLLTGEQEFARQAEIWQQGKESRITYVLATGYKIWHKLSVRHQSSFVPSLGGEADGS